MEEYNFLRIYKTLYTLPMGGVTTPPPSHVEGEVGTGGVYKVLSIPKKFIFFLSAIITVILDQDLDPGPQILRIWIQVLNLNTVSL